MKHINVKIFPLHLPSIFILSLFIIAMALPACRKNENTRKLETAEHIVWNHPDSARTILNSIDTAFLTLNEKMRRRLFLLEAADKLYEEHKDDSEIAAIIDYFITQNHSRRLHPIVLYYGGRVYSDLGQDTKALRCFKEALKLLPPATDTDLEGCLHSQLSYLYSAHKMFNRSRNHIQAAIHLSEADHDTVNIISGNLNLADIYIVRAENDSAQCIYDAMMPLVEDCNDSIIASTYYTQLAAFLYDTDRLHAADSIIHHHKIVYDKASRTSVLSITNRIDRASQGKEIDEEFYKSLTSDTDPGVRFMAYKYLAKGAEQRRDAVQMLDYTQKAFAQMKKMQRKFNTTSLLEMEKILDEAELENQNLELSVSNQRKQIVILILLALAVIIIGLAGVKISQSRMKRMALALDIEKLKSANRRRVMELEMEIAKINERNEKEMARLREEKMEEINAKEETPHISEEEQHLINTLSLAREKERFLRLLLAPEGSVTEEDFAKLQEALRAVYPNFIDTINGMGLKPKDYQDALLARIDVPQKICAQFFNLTPAAITNQRRRLLQKWSPNGSFHNWKEYLDSL